MLSLIDYGQFNPALPADHPFVGVETLIYYWTGTARDGLLYHHWGITMHYGFISPADRLDLRLVWPVRNGK